ncbi:DHH family phosphoesterase [Acetanaerobacterium elongatum]|uniref:Cyclic-di-AMP phosphodiesterase n=1 Tax=Acetanaerobacterium elongatum TaxID=258515 RepID=A0A1H0BQV8_9FIRM|nr:DHH family phosphoesterase [Acetanaerobacterium elongatum]SDN47972.1 c-di-AMP phosphodiesterase, consists of a GGDEF-like and DHH domains [Acetanaerobacterium elongatum]
MGSIKKRIWLYKPIIIAALVLSFGMSLMSLAIGQVMLFYAELALTLVVTALAIYQYRTIQNDVCHVVDKTLNRLNVLNNESAAGIPIPLVVIREKGEIIWYNELFASVVFDGQNLFGKSFDELFPTVDINLACTPSGVNVSYGRHCFTAYGMRVEDKNGTLVAMQWVENTELKALAQEYYESRQAVLLITVDNYDELTQTLKESEKVQLTGEVDHIIENFLAPTGAILTRSGRDRFTCIMEERYLRGVIEHRFDVLDRVRQITVGGRQPATLSIGVGRGGGSLRELEQMAKQALDMALGRGGDQAAVKTPGGYEFFGGISKGVEKRTKVKTRIMAAALGELIETSDNCIIMGHRFSDLDSFGASVGLCKSIRLMGKPAIIAIDREKNLVQSLMNSLIANGYEDAFVSPDEALQLVGKKTLLIVVDTHLPSMLESTEIYKACKTVAVIDHHRKMVGHIENAVIFYHEPYASSASEMVTELVQYFNIDAKLGRPEAEALLAGIMLDTKNFILKTGVRTFEAAAYLRKLGADTVEVKRLFSSSMEAYQLKSKIVSGAKVYKRCAVAVSDSVAEEMRIIAPQAADELLSISGVDASFVLYQTPENVTISARSLGSLNVQVIMEKMGGGGHLTMAGTYIVGSTLKNAAELLLKNIDAYYEENNSQS